MGEPGCKLGGRFSKCPSPSLTTCQYCARPFCAEHTYVLEGIEAVCARKQCVAKQNDLQLHLEYRERVRQRNGAGLCGVESCGPHPGLECSLCHGHFCDGHIEPRDYPLRQGRVILQRRLSVCGQCWKRRKVWAH